MASAINVLDDIHGGAGQQYYYANYDYGRGKVYLAAVHSNNNGYNGTLPNGGSPLSNVGATANGITGTLVTGLLDTSVYYNR